MIIGIIGEIIETKYIYIQIICPISADAGRGKLKVQFGVAF